jgi:hypothetical protein
MKLKRVDRDEAIGRARERLSAATCGKQGMSRLPVLFRQAQYLAGRRYRTWIEKLLPLDPNLPLATNWNRHHPQ